MEWFKPTIEEFGDPKKYKVLTYVWEHLKELDEEVQQAIKHYLRRVNNVSRTEIAKASPYVYKLIRLDFKERLYSMAERYDIPVAMSSRLDNYTHAKFVNALEDTVPFLTVNSTETQWKQHETRNNVTKLPK